MSTGREFWRCCIIIIPLLSKHKPPHQPRRCDAVWGHNRNMPQPSGVGGWGGENRACFSKPCRCRRTDSLGSPFDTSEMQSKRCYAHCWLSQSLLLQNLSCRQSFLFCYEILISSLITVAKLQEIWDKSCLTSKIFSLPNIHLLF